MRKRGKARKASKVDDKNQGYFTQKFVSKNQLAASLKFFLAIALFFLIAVIANAGDVIVENGKLDVSDNLYVDSSGNVGIGTTNPTAKLHVVGKATITGGVDPPFIFFSNESHQNIRHYAKSIRHYAKGVEEHEKVMMFWNGESNRIKIYVISDDKFLSDIDILIKFSIDLDLT